MKTVFFYAVVTDNVCDKSYYQNMIDVIEDYSGR